MPMYFNRTNKDVTIFLQNAVPIKFLAGEHKRLIQEGLERQYARFLIVVPDPADKLRESKEGPKKPQKSLISEVKQPGKNKELVKEPLQEDSKGARRVIHEEPKLNEGYSPAAGEQTLASAGR